MKEIARWVRHNQGFFVSLVVSVGLVVWTFGCESKVTSLIHAGKMVSGEELKLELEAESARLESELEQLIKQAELKYKELARKDAIKQKLLDFTLLAGEAGTLNPSGLVGLLVGVLGIGAVVDNRIKDKVIKNRPLKGES